MSTPTTFDQSSVLEALGARSSRTLPNIDPTNLAPVIITADMSESFAAQAFTARGFATTTVPGSVEFPQVQLISLAAGGILVERVDIHGRDIFGTVITSAGLIKTTGRGTFNVPVAGRIFDVGGEPVVSLVNGGTLAAFVPGAEAQIFVDSFGQKTYTDFGWFIPPGDTLRVTAFGTALINFSVSLQWREIPQQAGSQ